MGQSQRDTAPVLVELVAWDAARAIATGAGLAAVERNRLHGSPG